MIFCILALLITFMTSDTNVQRGEVLKKFMRRREVFERRRDRQ